MNPNSIQPGHLVVCRAFYSHETRTWFNSAQRRRYNKVAFLVINKFNKFGDELSSSHFGAKLSREHWYQTDKGSLCLDASFINFCQLIEPPK